MSRFKSNNVLIEKENEVLTETLNDMLKGIKLGHLAEKFKPGGIDLNLVLDMGSDDLRRMMVLGSKLNEKYRNSKHALVIL